MPPALLASLILLGAAPAQARVQPDPKPGLPPLAVLLGAEVDDLDRDLGHQREIASSSRQRLATAQRLAARGAASQDELEQEAADARFQEARVAEMAAVRDLKAYQRDVLAATLRADPAREYALVQDVLTSQEGSAQVEVDFRAYRKRQAQALHRRNAISLENRDRAELDADTALASVALLRARRAHVALEFARRPGAPRADPAELVRLEIDYARIRVAQDRISASIAHDRADLARDSARPKGTPVAQIEALNKAAEQADATLAADLKRLADLEQNAPRSGPVPGVKKEEEKPQPPPDRKPG